MHLKLLFLALAIACFFIAGFMYFPWRAGQPLPYGGSLVAGGLFFWSLSSWPGID